MNRAAQRLIGRGEMESIGKPVAECIRILDRYKLQPIEIPWESVLQDEITLIIDQPETALRVPGAAPLPVSLQILPYRTRIDLSAGLLVILNAADPVQDQTGDFQMSLEDYRDLFENSGTANLILGVDTTILLANAAGTTLTGYTGQELRGMRWTALVLPEDLERIQYIHQTSRGEQTFGQIQYEFRLLRRDRDIREVLATVTRIPGTRHSVATVLDITERNRLELAWRESEQVYRTVFENTGTATIIIEADTTIALANSETQNLMGFTKAELEGRMSWTKLIHPDDVQTMMGYHKARRETGKEVPRNYDFRLITKDGETKNVMLTVALIPGTGRSIASCLDVTEARKLQQALRESEQIYRTVFENTGTATIMIEADTTISLANSEFIRQSGHSREELIGMSWTKLVHPDDLKMMVQYHQTRRELPGEVPRTYEFRFISKTGGITDIFLTVALIQGTDKSIASLQDITERKRLEKALRESEEMYRTVFENTGTATVLIDNDTTISLVNEEFSKLYGISKEEIEGKMSWLDFVYEPDKDWMRQYHEERRRYPLGTPNRYEFRFVGRDGVIRNTLNCVAMIPGTNKSVASFVDISDLRRAQEEIRELNAELEQKVISRTQDLMAMNEELQAMNGELVQTNSTLAEEIAERERIEQALEQTNRELSRSIEQLKVAQSQLVQSEKLASLGSLVAGVAHEINTPVGLGVTAASTLDKVTREFTRAYQEGNADKQDLLEYLDDTKTAVSIILPNLQRAARLIRSFKQVSIDQSSEVRREFNVREYLDEILLSLHPKLKKTKQTVVIDCEPDIEIDSFPGPFAQIITNLVMNSLTHAFEPQQPGEIRINARNDGDDVEMVFSDNGCGMAPEVLARIFDPFYTTRRGQGGTGLGLYILYNIVTMQFGGTIQCESEPGKGTVFTIRFPARKEAAS